MPVIAVDFSRLSTTAPEDLTQIKALIRQAAIGLYGHVKKPIDIAQVHPSAFGAFVGGTVYRMGIVIGMYPTLRGRPDDEDVLVWAARRDAAPREIRYEVFAEVEWLRDHMLVNGGDFGREHADPEFPSLEETVAWVVKNCFKAPVLRITSEELDEWERKVVIASAGTEKERKLSLKEAVRAYGPVYRYEISPETLAENHGFSLRHARTICEAVLKILPRRREIGAAEEKKSK